MYLGIDVGGAHTDAVAAGENGVTATAKIVTDHDNLLKSVKEALAAVLDQVDPREATRLNLSTTLSTNAVIEDKGERVGVIASAGPGVDPENYRMGDHFHVIDGFVDHRGVEQQPLNRDQLQAALKSCYEDGVKVFAVGGKFSTRNPVHENAARDYLQGRADFTSFSHRLSGVLNFPRRLVTAYYNSAIWRVYNDFAHAAAESVANQGLHADIHVLKADGGTMPLFASKDMPAASIRSGPAASVMGVVALCEIMEDAVILDIGGTTTDIAVFADGAPIIEKSGMTVAGRPTLVQSLLIDSLGVGGDSVLRLEEGRLTVGPDRAGPPLSKGGPRPTLTDAMNVLHLTDFGDRRASEDGLAQLAQAGQITREDLAREAVDQAVTRIKNAAFDLVERINQKPVYTIHEFLEGKRLKPEKVYVMGGPAEALAQRLGDAFSLPVVAPRYAAVANAVGAALTHTTWEAELFADTQQGRMIIPALEVERPINRKYDLEQAEKDVKKEMAAHLERLGAWREELVMEVIEKESFNMVEGPAAVGRRLRARCRIKPGVLLQSKTCEALV